MKIQQTSNYDLFTTLTGNRTINEKKVGTLVKDIKNGLNLLPYCPIIVSKNKEGLYLILDGQHRFTACVKLDHQVHFVIAKDISLRDLARMNNRQDKWKTSDFLDCYLEIGIEDYRVLKTFMEEYDNQYYCTIGLLYYGHSNYNADSIERFKSGTFTVRHLDRATEIMDLILSVFGRYVWYNKRYFIAAIIEIMDKDLIDWDRMKEKVKQAPNVLDFQTTKKDWLVNLEKLYNHRMQKRAYIS